MRQALFRTAIGLTAFVAAGLGLLLLRNSEIEAGALALKEGNGAAAVERFTPLAKLGDSKAQFLLGSMYAYGWGVPKSDADAIYWFRRAAMFRQGESDPAAPAALGVAKSYTEGTDGVKADKAESAKWLRLAAAGGSKEAATLLGNSPAN